MSSSPIYRFHWEFLSLPRLLEVKSIRILQRTKRTDSLCYSQSIECFNRTFDLNWSDFFQFYCSLWNFSYSLELTIFKLKNSSSKWFNPTNYAVCWPVCDSWLSLTSKKITKGANNGCLLKWQAVDHNSGLFVLKILKWWLIVRSWTRRTAKFVAPSWYQLDWKLELCTESVFQEFNREVPVHPVYFPLGPRETFTNWTSHGVLPGTCE